MKIKYIYEASVVSRGREKKLSELKKNSTLKISINCPICKETFKRHFFILQKTGNFMCQKCKIKSYSEKKLEVNKQYNMLKVLKKTRTGFSLMKCECGKETEVNNTNVKSGKTKSCGCIISKKLKEFHAKNPDFQSEEKHPMWKGGTTSKNRRIRATAKYKEWRSEVFKRDNFTCKKCGVVSKNIEAHHINELSNNLDKVYDLNNGVTFCRKCHKKFHNIYGNSKLNIDMIREFNKNT